MKNGCERVCCVPILINTIKRKGNSSCASLQQIHNLINNYNKINRFEINNHKVTEYYFIKLISDEMINYN